MLRGLAPLALLVTALALSGCSGAGPKPTGDVCAAASDAGTLCAASGEMTIVGLVQNETFVPVPGALVTLRQTPHVATTDAGGAFRFQVPLAPYLVDVAANGFSNATLNAEPLANVSLSFVLASPVPPIPAPVTTHFTGHFQCAFEALIIPGSCDILLDMANQSVVENRDVFQTGLGARWSTAVIDLDFEGQPGLDGLRITLRAKNDADQLGTYEDYGKFHGPSSFSFRIEPEQVLPEGDRPVPANATSLELAVYPHGHGWHALCSDPVPEGTVPPGSCPLGVGAGQNIQFDLYVTVFFVEPAPADFTLLA